MIKPALQDDAFLADVESSRGDESDSFRLWWLGQSGFLLQWKKRHVLFDPYLSDSLTTKYAGTDKPHVRISERVVAPQRLDFIDMVTSSHGHTDHLDGETLQAISRVSPYWHYHPEAITQLVWERYGNTYPFLNVGMNAGKVSGIFALGIELAAVPAAHDRLETDENGNHLYLGYLAKFGGFCVYHSGDTIVYESMADLLRPHAIDVAILPINGKIENMNGHDAAHLAKDIGAKLVIPCHYDMFEFNTADPYEQFVPECEKIGQRYRVLKLGERFTYPEQP